MCGRMGIKRRDAVRADVLGDYLRAQRAGLLVDSGVEASVDADDWLNTREGEAAVFAFANRK